MSFILTLTLLLHGAIHILGFVKSVRPNTLPMLRAPISRVHGALWLVTATLFTTAAAMHAVAKPYWFYAAALGVVLSQYGIVRSWKDARFGTLVNVALLFPIAFSGLTHAPWSTQLQYQRESTRLVTVKPSIVPNVSEESIRHLPTIVQRYLHFVGAVGKHMVLNYAVEFRGALRSNPGDDWMDVVVHQQSTTSPPARLFLVEARMFGVPVTAYHRLVDGNASFSVSAASLFNIAHAEGAIMNASESVTLLNDMVLLAPATLVDTNITWQQIDSLTVRAMFKHAGTTVSATLYFSNTGALRTFVSEDRYRTTDGKTYERYPWHTPISAWTEAGGRRFPKSASAVWSLPEGDFEYGKLEVISINYNRNSAR